MMSVLLKVSYPNQPQAALRLSSIVSDLTNVFSTEGIVVHSIIIEEEDA